MHRRFKGRLPWALMFSFVRAIQQPALDIWRGEPGNAAQAQSAVQHRAACNRAARQGEYTAATDKPA
jgi:fructose-bisphosphate aldolase class I